MDIEREYADAIECIAYWGRCAANETASAEDRARWAAFQGESLLDAISMASRS